MGIPLSVMFLWRQNLVRRSTSFLSYGGVEKRRKRWRGSEVNRGRYSEFNCITGSPPMNTHITTTSFTGSNDGRTTDIWLADHRSPSLLRALKATMMQWIDQEDTIYLQTRNSPLTSNVFSYLHIENKRLCRNNCGVLILFTFSIWYRCE